MPAMGELPRGAPPLHIRPAAREGGRGVSKGGLLAADQQHPEWRNNANPGSYAYSNEEGWGSTGKSGGKSQFLDGGNSSQRLWSAKPLPTKRSRQYGCYGGYGQGPAGHGMGDNVQRAFSCMCEQERIAAMHCREDPSEAAASYKLQPQWGRDSLKSITEAGLEMLDTRCASGSYSTADVGKALF